MHYKDIDDVIDAYREYANNAEKMVIACGDDPYTHSLDITKPIFYYGISDDNDIRALNIEYKNTGTVRLGGYKDSSNLVKKEYFCNSY